MDKRKTAYNANITSEKPRGHPFPSRCQWSYSNNVQTIKQKDNTCKGRQTMSIIRNHPRSTVLERSLSTGGQNLYYVAITRIILPGRILVYQWIKPILMVKMKLFPAARCEKFTKKEDRTNSMGYSIGTGESESVNISRTVSQNETGTRQANWLD